MKWYKVILTRIYEHFKVNKQLNDFNIILLGITTEEINALITSPSELQEIIDVLTRIKHLGIPVEIPQ